LVKSVSYGIFIGCCIQTVVHTVYLRPKNVVIPVFVRAEKTCVPKSFTLLYFTHHQYFCSFQFAFKVLLKTKI